MTQTRYGVKVPDIGCTIVQDGITITTSGKERPHYAVSPNDPAAYRRLIEMVDADARDDRAALK